MPNARMHSWLPVAMPILAASLWLTGCCCPTIPLAPQPGGSSLDQPWTEFTSTEGNFRALFPTDPTHATSDDGREHRHTSQVRGGMLLFRIAYELNAGVELSPEERMRITTESLAAKAVQITPLTLQGHPGAEARYQTRDGRDTFHFRHRVYHVGDTSYQVMVVVANEEEAEAESNRFFDSFELIDPN